MDKISYLPTTKKARVEIIPLIDVVFFLLATFVLFTLSLDKIRSFEIPLPPSGEWDPGETDLFLRTTAYNTYTWTIGRGGQPEQLSLAELRPRLQDYKNHTLRPRVIISGDPNANYGSTITALDETVAAGIKSVSIATTGQ